MSRTTAAPIAIAVILLVLPASAGDPPDCEVSPITGSIECVDVALKGAIWDVRYMVDAGQGQPLITEMVTDTPDIDTGGRIALNTAGSAGVTWESDNVIYFRERDPASAEWSATLQLSDTGTDSQEPEITHVGGKYWVAFQFDDVSGEKGIAVNGVIDDPQPILGVHEFETTVFNGALDVLTHGESGQAWVTWVHDGDEVGWSQYDDATEAWGSVSYETYAVDNVKAARGRIRDFVLGI